MDEKTRAYIYRVAVAVLPLLVILGVVSQEVVPVVVSILAAALLPGLAAANTSTKG